MINSDFNPSLSHPYYFIRKGLLEKIKSHAHYLQGKLLDFGCGSKPYKALFGHVTSYTGVDFYNEGHPHANEQIDFFYDGKSLPFTDNSFDSIFASEVFEHIFNLNEILPELNRVLIIGGKMLITCPFVWPEHEKPYDYARYTLFALKHELEKNGFEIVTTDKAGDYFSTIMQMRIAYLHDVLLPKLTLPFLVSLAKAILIPLVNIYGIALGKILPKNSGLYQNNIVVVQKMR